MSTGLDDLEELYVSEHLRLQRVAAGKVGPAHAADVVQDVFIALWERGTRAVSRNYLTGATRYAAIGRYRAECRRVALLGRLVEEQYAAPVAGPDRLVAARRDLARLNEAIGALPERTRQAFLLNRVHDCTYDEIAAVLGVSYSTVEREIARALLACRASID
ncbi:RNA polymerase sigma factor [Ancylobacter oerskovii]|uniref:RNA polymerase sigma factor n=1 Tax=Ancylobacter oerskovii TaxID=459519 RepID=A0ABW4YU03_9HYPH|nr:RNA polymerase sigma factor [Ancylobacter oerskovii]MBS7543230.1 RNA polymerase sigma factor [Ancylobacter oerskovii]